MATDTDSDADSTTEYAETTPRTGIARCAPLDGQTAPYTVHGVAIGPNDVTNGKNELKIWPEETLREAAETLEGVPLNKNHDSKRVESVVAEVVAAEYEPDVGVIFEAEVDDEAVATKIARGRLEVSPHACHRADGEDDEGRLIVTDARSLDLAVVPRGASPSNYIESGQSEMLAALSATDVASMFDDASPSEPMPDATTDDPKPTEQDAELEAETDADAESEAESEAALEADEEPEDDESEAELEADGATTTEDVALDGTTAVTTTESFDSIDALKLDAETQGDVVVSDSIDDELARIHGANEYEETGGDPGITVLGSGLHADLIGTEYERSIDDQITRDAEELAVEVRSAGLSVSNNYDKSGVMGTVEQAVHVGQQDVEFTATVAGQFVQHEHLTAQDFDITWTFSGGTVTLTSAVLSDLGDIGPASGDVISTIDNTFSPTSVSISAN
jgi:hypothetical protein